MNLILHPGYGKCGSSTIQSELRKNKGFLKKQKVFLVDTIAVHFLSKKIGEKRRHTDLVGLINEVLIDKKKYKEFKDGLKSLIERKKNKGFNTFLLSAENLVGPWTMEEPGIHNLFVDLFDDIKVLLYIRRQDDWILSAWNQWAHKSGISLESYVNKFLADTRLFSKYIDYLISIYGKNRLIVTPLNSKAFYSNDIFIDFCQKANLSLPENYTLTAPKNVGNNPFLSEITRRIPHIYTRNNEVKSLIQRLSDDKEIILKNPNKDFLHQKMRLEIMLNFQEENEYLRQNFFPDLNFDDLYSIPRNVNSTNLEAIEYQLENIKDMLALQLDLILRISQQDKINTLKYSKLRRFVSNTKRFILKKVIPMMGISK